LKKYVLAKTQGVGFAGHVKKENHRNSTKAKEMKRAIND